MAPRPGDKDTRSLESILESRPDSLLFARLADAYRQKGDIAQAIELCTKGLNRYPHYTTGRILLGRCYLEQQKYNEAVEEFSAVCMTDRRNQMAIKMLADIFVQQGMEERAGDLYALLLKMDPGNPTFVNLSSQYHSFGNSDLFTILGTDSQPDSGVAPALESQSVPVFGDNSPVDAPDQTVADADIAGLMQPDGIETASVGPDGEDGLQSAPVSGTDVADRMSMLFEESASESKPMQVPGNDSGVEAEVLTEDEAASGGADVSGTDVADRIEELFSDATSGGGGAPADMAAGLESVADAQGSGPVTDEILPSTDGLNSEEVSGADVSERIDELFADSASKTVPQDESGSAFMGATQVESEHDGNSVQTGEAQVDFGSLNFGEITIGDDAVLQTDEQQPPESASDVIEPVNTDSFEDIDSVVKDEDAPVPDFTLDIPEDAEASENRFSGEPEDFNVPVSGTDMMDPQAMERMEEIFLDSESDSKTEAYLLSSEKDAPVGDNGDAAVDLDEKRQEQPGDVLSMDSPTSMAQMTDDLFADNQDVVQPVDQPADSADNIFESLPEQDFISSELTETLQFDGELFEQMLNPSIEDSPFMADDPSVPEDAGSSVPQGGEAASFDEMAVTDLTEDFDLMSISGTDEDKREEHGASGEESVFDMSDDSLAGMGEVPRPSGALIEESQSDEPDLVIDEKEFLFSSGDSSSHKGSTAESAQDEPGLMAEAEGPVSMDAEFAFAQEEQFPDQTVSDKTEVIEVAPSGEDILEKLDELFPGKQDAATAAADKSGSMPGGDIFSDSLVVEDGPEADPGVEDHALIETMELSRSDIPGSDEFSFEMLSVDNEKAGSSESAATDVEAGGEPVVTGDDIDERLDALFPGADLLSISTVQKPLPDDGQEEDPEPVADFYTITGGDATLGMSEEMPEDVAEVEFDALMEQQDAVLPDVELYEECTPETKNVAVVAPETGGVAEIDSRDEPFDIPDHVLTPTLADIYFQQGQHQLALQIYDRLLEREPDNERLGARILEIRREMESVDASVHPADSQQKTQRSGKSSARKAGKKGSSSGKPLDNRPLAGVRIKKRKSNGQTSSRRKKS